jgi:DNA-binding response OmpR family regulator
MPYRILIVEDDKIIRQELKNLLERYLYTVVAVEDFETAADFAVAQNPHLILLDLNLPFYDGFHICREIRRRSKIPIIVVTSRDSEMDELMSLNLGADHFVTKPYNTQILLAKITAILTRVYDARDARELRFADLTLDLGKGTVKYGGRSSELTKNEGRILQLLLENRGSVVSREDIMHALWQTDAFVDDNTLTVNINRLRKKLCEIGARDFLKTKRGLGYSL